MDIIEATSTLMNWRDYRSDEVTTRKALEALDSNGTLMVRSDGHLWDYNISRWALGQFASSMSIPGLRKYIRSCPTELAAHNLNWWIGSNGDKKIKLALLGKRIIGVLSTRYTNYSNMELFEDVATVTRRYDGRKIGNFTLTDECMDGTMIIPEFTVEGSLAPLRRIGIGLHIRNSEVGYAAALVAASIYDLKYGYNIPLGEKYLSCTFARMIHTAKDHTQFKVDIDALVALISDRYKDVLNLYSATSKHTITVSNIRDLIEEYNMAKDVLDGKLGIEIFSDDTDEKDRFTIRDIIDGIAAAAAMKKYPARWDLERIGGNVLDDFADILGW